MAKKPFNLLRFFFKCCWKGFFFFVILLGLSVFFLWLALPRVGDFKNPIEAAISKTIKKNADIDTIYAGWHGLHPYLGLKNIQITDPKTKRVLFKLREAEVELDLIESIRKQRFMHGQLSIYGVILQLRRDVSGAWVLLTAGDDEIYKLKKNTSAKDKPYDLSWLALLGQQEVIIKNGILRFQDDLTGEEYTFKGIESSLKHDTQTLQLKGFAALPHSLGNSVSFLVDLEGVFDSPESIKGKVYLKGQRLNTVGWHDLIPDLSSFLPSARLTPELWIDIDKGKVFGVFGSLEGSGIASTDKSFGYSIVSDYYWQPKNNGWTLNLRNFAIDDGQYTWPATKAKVDFVRLQDGYEMEIGSNFFRIEDAVGILKIFPDLSMNEALADIRPQGDLRQLYLKLNKATQTSDNPLKYIIQADFDRFSLSPNKSFPGFINLTGRLNLTETGGTIDLNTRSAQLEFPAYLSDPILIDLVKGRLDLRQDKRDWSIEAKKFEWVSPEMQMQGRFLLKGMKNKKRSPHLDLALQIGKAKVTKISRYFPAKVMKPKLTQWLEQALKGGVLSQGNIVFRGHVTDFPFENASGRFAALFKVKDGVFSYASGWPKLRALNGLLYTDGIRFDANLKGGILDSKIKDVSISIDDMRSKNAIVNVNGHVFGSPQDGIEYLLSTPIKQSMGKFLNELSFSKGTMLLALKLDFPLKKGKHFQLKGVANLKKSSLIVKTAQRPIEISAIKGDLLFTQDEFSAENLAANVLGVPAMMDIETKRPKFPDHNKKILISAVGKFNPRDAERITGFPWKQWMRGEANWSAELSIASGKNTQSQLSIVSDMRGIDISMPAPFFKKKTTRFPLKISLNFADSQTFPWTIQYGQSLSGQFFVGEPDSGLAFQKAHFVLGAGDVELPTSNRIKLTGETDFLSWEAWNNEVFAMIPTSLTVFQPIEMDVRVKKAEILQRQFSDINLNVTKQKKQWLVQVKGHEVSGRVVIPNNTSLPIKANFEHLHLKEEQLVDSLDDSGEITPNEVAAFTLDCNKFTYDGMDFGQFSVIASKRFNALALDHLEANTKDTQIIGKGEWVMDSLPRHKQETRMDLIVDTKNVANTLKEWLYTQGIGGGTGEATVSLAWPGSPRDYSLATIKGNINLLIKNGRLLDIEPGAGRIFGLLSLQSFSRRLSLDFSDIFSKGFSFNKISANFSIHDGNAYADDFHMEGPAAQIEMTGRAGLVEQDYDQIVTVIPQVGSSLPLAGALAAGVGVGAAVFVIQKIFAPQIDKAVRIQYAVTGSWDKPLFTKIIKNKKRKK